jgi:hypothetical protein
LSTLSAALDLAALFQAPSRSGVITRSGDVQKPSEWPQFLESSHQDSFIQDGCRVSTNPVLSINDLSVNNKLSGTIFASATPHLPLHGQALTGLTAHVQVKNVTGWATRTGRGYGSSQAQALVGNFPPATNPYLQHGLPKPAAGFFLSKSSSPLPLSLDSSLTASDHVAVLPLWLIQSHAPCYVPRRTGRSLTSFSTLAT